MRYQAQAVLRRDDLQAPLRLAGVLLAGAFYPGTIRDAWGPLDVEVGLIALAPLTPVVRASPQAAAASALKEARSQWARGDAPSEAASLTWRPLRDVSGATDGRTVGELIALMSSANDARLTAAPSTPPYHRAARELERLATAMYDTTSSEERAAKHSSPRPAALLVRRPDG